MIKLRSIQVLRGLAACAVVLLHSTIGEFHRGAGTFYWGAAGVDIFFVISGFIITTVSHRETPHQFAFRRFIRVYPLWWIAVAPWIIVLGSASNIGPDLFLWPIWSGAYHVPDLTLGWTLGFEVLFYAGTMLAMCVGKRLPLGIFFLCLVGSAFTQNALVRFIGNPMILNFLAGAMLTKLPREEKFGWPLVVLGLAGIWAAPTVTYEGLWVSDPTLALYRVVLWGFPSLLIVHGVLSLEDRLTKWRLGVLLGDASYSIYLFHFLSTELLPLPWWGLFVAGVLIGISVHFLLEKRLMSLSKQLFSRRRSETAPQNVSGETA